MLKVTFFHDVICPFCYVTSKRLRRVVPEFKVEVVHKSFSIISSLEDLKFVAPDEESVREFFKSEFSILKRFMPDYEEGKVISKGNLGYVWSMPPLMACKAAEFQRGSEGYWEYFDRAQDAFFLEGQNVADEEVLLSIAKSLNFDVERFREDMGAKKTKLAVISDEEEARAMGIRGVPALIINDQWIVRGVPTEEKLRDVFSDIEAHGEPRKVRLKAYWEKDD
ncbi:DSBA oxidoreductase [Sulfodiicoccus acidiphilus]|uniref:DSBA oxidoreductase n=1 Tax=Sulfodiicoccus acidiphilus TaxID=1670455 RepID=A0A348B1E7_9CREN|nr:DsbA family protein [Sulfodiicoccus acidiphilus]BBD71999.1 DSBA oxidoreductase [Sulfodiicoccus acidiphilus]GGT92017.1 DSBA oxidoreductase [Sulfodiicoccus acidiphilus]